jgi:hypothetical protein
MSNPRIPEQGEDLRALLERELEERRGRAPEPGEIFVLSETAELPVEWALLEARPKSFLAIPADTQPLAGSRDFALGANVLSGPLVLRCGHAAEIEASRLRPELRTGLLDPHSLAAARALQAALANGTAAADPVGEEVDRDPEYRDWVEEVLDPARGVLVGQRESEKERDGSRGGKVVGIEDWRGRRGERVERIGGSRFAGLIRRASPWLAAALLAVALGLSWQEVRRLQQAVDAPTFDEPAFRIAPDPVRGETEVELPRGTERVRLSGEVPSDRSGPMSLVLLGRGGAIIAQSKIVERVETDPWSMTVARRFLSPGLFKIELREPNGNVIDHWTIRIVETEPVP